MRRGRKRKRAGGWLRGGKEVVGGGEGDIRRVDGYEGGRGDEKN